MDELLRTIVITPPSRPATAAGLGFHVRVPAGSRAFGFVGPEILIRRRGASSRHGAKTTTIPTNALQRSAKEPMCATART
ncbi:hypothetical protein ACWGS9_35305, partial [Bradyrhizobium sp. Arg314]